MQFSNDICDTAGVYEIECAITGEKYVGSTRHMRERANDHLCRLRKNLHSCRRLQQAWNRYGESEFRFTVVEIVHDRRNLAVREQFYIDTTVGLFNQRAATLNVEPQRAAMVRMMFDKDWLTRKEAAAYLTSQGYPTSPRTLERLACNRTGPPYQQFLGKLVAYNKALLIQWAESVTVKVPCDIPERPAPQLAPVVGALSAVKR